MNAQTAHDTMLNPKQAGNLIGRSPETILRWIKQKRLKGWRRVMGRYQIPRQAVLDMVEVDGDGPLPQSEETREALARHGLA